MNSRIYLLALAMMLALRGIAAAEGRPNTVDFRYSPPKWQATICLPDDPHKSLVDRSGELLYHYRQGGREFGTRVAVELAPDAVWQGQELIWPRVPIVRTHREAEGLRISEEAFVVVAPESAQVRKDAALRRLDGNSVLANWAKPAGEVDSSLSSIAVHFDGALRFRAEAKSARIALALCEGFWNESGQRMQVLQVEGAEPVKVDTVADIGTNRAAAFWFDGRDTNGDGGIDVTIAAAPEAGDRNTILNGLWAFPSDLEADDAALLAGRLDARASAIMDAAIPLREDIVIVRVSNTGDTPRTVNPVLVVDSRLGVKREGGRLLVRNREWVASSLAFAGELEGARIPLEAIEIPAQGEASFCISYGGKDHCSLARARAERERAIEFWMTDSGLPFGRIEVPDPGIQALLDASVRNIWQSREIKNGLPAFQVGPTVYRGLWIVDGAFILEAATIMGAGREARAGVEYVLSKQSPSGAFQLLTPKYYKENGIVLWTCVRHAQLTQDKAWLESVWPKLSGAANFIKHLRQLSLENGNELDDGLMPPGDIDGGLSGRGRPEYTNVYWNLLGMRAFIKGAHWLGKTDEAAQWQQEYDDFMATFRRAAERDTLKDENGNSYLPTLMGEHGPTELPQRAQWAFCHAVYPGQIFPQDDPLVAGNLAMLADTEREGMVYGTGWDATGLWNYFASFYGHAWLWQGNGRKAANSLYAFANHAAPVLVWREEQSLQGEKYKVVGDMPHNWASAEFIRLAFHLLALDRNDELHLFEGLPAEWAQPGMRTAISGAATPFGPLTVSLEIADDGRTADLLLEPLADAGCKAVVVHLGGWASDESEKTLSLDPGRKHRISIPLASDRP
jgi:hypothetical protein